MEHPYTYVFVRTDISFEQQLVQSAHAALLASEKFKNPGSSSIIMIGVKNEEHLLREADKLKNNGINSATFFEPDFGPMGNTAFCTEPLIGDSRKALRKYQLYKYKVQ